MKQIGVVTCARSDFWIYRPLLQAIRAHPDLELRIVATGMHLSAQCGLTVNDITRAGFEVFERVESLLPSDTPEAVGQAIGRGVEGFARLFARWRPDVLVVLGDRFDMFPAALAALPHRIPVAHLYGGDLTEGAIDDALRHSLTKLSHLHCVSTAQAAQRILQMGEEPWRVMVCGALAIDAIRTFPREDSTQTARRFGFQAHLPTALVTYHPVTLEHERTAAQITNVLAALEESGLQCVCTYPNADTASQQIIRAIEHFCAGHANRQVVANAGQSDYFHLMHAVSVMVGNSSSGLVEAPSFKLPVVNIGTRQDGRLRAGNVIDCGYRTQEIREALVRALSPDFKAAHCDGRNPYGDGYAAQRIVTRLTALEDAPCLLRKKFVEPAPLSGTVAHAD